MKRFVCLIILSVIFTACGKKELDVSEQVRNFMGEWERAVDSQNAVLLDSLLVRPENSAAIDPQKFLDELFSAPDVKSVNLRGRQFAIGQNQATVSGLLIRSGIADSMAHLKLILLKTKKGWKLAAYRWESAVPAGNTSRSST